MIPIVLDLAALRTLAERAARAGGEVARARAGDPGYLSWKGHRDVVSGASLEVQAAILGVLAGETPGFGILAEEGPDDEPVPTEAEHLWIVDPICGSLNFVQGVPYYAVSIALRSGGDIVLGVVFDPSRDELVAATLDERTTLNGMLTGVQHLSEGYEAFERAAAGTDWPHDRDRRLDAEQAILTIGRQVTSLTVMGAPALSLCAVACGRLHVYWHLDLRVWDVAAGSLILRQAGGHFTDAQGGSWLHSDGGYIASNGIVHGWTLRSLQQVFEARRLA
jgi:myo-inositol-1(or 4)-monophosphatase